MVIIANPIYDTVFKALMQEERIARFFIGTLLGENIVEVQASQQEITHYDKKTHQLTLLRMDFVALIRDNDGNERKILIELQKARKETDLIRFRTYLGESYIETANPFPITTIYILGFNLPGINTPCMRVARNYYDLVNDCEIKGKNPYIEHLTHDSYIVQTQLIQERHRSRLDQILNLFEQTNFVKVENVNAQMRAFKTFSDDIPDLAEETRLIIDKLALIAARPEERKRLSDEIKYQQYVDEMFGEEHEKLAKQAKELVEKDTVIAEKDTVIAETKTELAETKAELAQKDRELAELKAAITKMQTRQTS